MTRSATTNSATSRPSTRLPARQSGGSCVSEDAQPEISDGSASPRRPIPASGGPAIRRRELFNAFLLTPPLPWARLADAPQLSPEPPAGHLINGTHQAWSPGAPSPQGDPRARQRFPALEEAAVSPRQRGGPACARLRVSRPPPPQARDAA